MKEIIFVAFLFVAFTYAQRQRCPPNQEYNECGTACPATCKDNGILKNCIAVCKAGCFCKAGLVLDDQGNCIDPKNCPASPSQQCTKPHQKYSDCGTACEPRCDNPKPQICTMQCVRGCFCESGHVKDSLGNCILEKDCPKSPPVVTAPPLPPPTNQCSKPFQTYSECGSACEATCDNPNPTICDKRCVKGCFCNAGYVKDSQGNCIKSRDCPVTKTPPIAMTLPPVQQCTKANQKFIACGSACEPTCKDPKPQICTMQCVRGCFCESGFVKNENGDCVLLKDCPKTDDKKCPQNETWSNECVAPRDCQGPYCPNNTYQKMCKIRCPNGGGCVCKDGYLRDNNLNCVLKNDCNRNRPTLSPRTSTTRG